MNVRKDIFEGDKEFIDNTQKQVAKNYSKAPTDDRVASRLDKIEAKLDSALDQIDSNASGIKKIQRQFTKQVVWKILKWVVILGITYYVYTSVISPMIDSVITTMEGQGVSMGQLKDTDGNNMNFIELFKKFFTESAQ